MGKLICLSGTGRWFHLIYGGGESNYQPTGFRLFCFHFLIVQFSSSNIHLSLGDTDRPRGDTEWGNSSSEWAGKQA